MGIKKLARKVILAIKEAIKGKKNTEGLEYRFKSLHTTKIKKNNKKIKTLRVKHKRIED